MKLADIKEVLLAEVLVGHDKLDTPVRAGAASDLMSDLLTGPTHGAVLLTGLTNIQVIRASVISGVAAVVILRGKRPTQDMISQAADHGLPLMSTPFTMFTACGRLVSRGLRGVEEKAGEDVTRDE